MKKLRLLTRVLFLLSIFCNSAFAQANEKLAKVIEKHQSGLIEAKSVLRVLNSEIKSVKHATKLTLDYKDKYIVHFITQVKEANIQLDMESYLAAIKAFRATKNVENALMLFDELIEIGLNPDITHYNLMISLCIAGDNYDAAMDIFRKGVTNSIFIDSNLKAKELDFHIDKWFTEASINRLIELEKVDPGHLCGISSSMLFMLLEHFEFEGQGLAGRIIIVGYNGRSILRESVTEFLDYYHYNYELSIYGRFIIDKRKKFHSRRMGSEASCQSFEENHKYQFIKKFASDSLSYAAACSIGSLDSERDLNSNDNINEGDADQEAEFDAKFEVGNSNSDGDCDIESGTYAQICKIPKKEKPAFSLLVPLGSSKFAKLSPKRKNLLGLPSSACFADAPAKETDIEEKHDFDDLEQGRKLMTSTIADKNEPELTLEIESEVSELVANSKLKPTAKEFVPTYATMLKLEQKQKTGNNL